MVLPVHDSGRNSAPADYEMFSDYEKALWSHQLGFWVARQKVILEVPVNDAPDPPMQVTYTVSGTNARVTINSSDDSVNVVNQTPPEVFQQLLAAVRGTTADSQLVADMVAAIEDMQRDYGSDSFLNRYRSFMAIPADHMQVFGPVVAPYLPVLPRLLTSN